MPELIIHAISLDPDVELQGIQPFQKELAHRSREQRILSVAKQSKQHGFSVRFWEGVVDEPKFKAIARAHKRIIQYAKDNHLKEVCIMEDDCVLTAPGALEFFLKNKPRKFDMYFAGMYSAEIQEGKIINGFSGMTLYIVREQFYDFILSFDESDHIDRWLGNFACDKQFYVCVPYCCYQIQGFSDNQRKVIDYSAYYVGREFFGKRPE